MSRARTWWAVGLVISAAALGADGASPEDLLKSKELRRAGTTYVLPDEALVAKKLNAARALYKRVSLALMQQRAFEQGTQDNQAQIQEMMQQRIMMNQELQQATSVAQNNRLVALINELNDRVNLLRQQDADPKLQQEIVAQVPRQREAYIQAVLDLRQLVDATNEKYKGLAEDAEVKDALTALNQKSKAKLTLGPTRAYLANSKLLEKIEGSVLTETVELRKQGGVFWLDVTFNGKITRPMVFDTGASLITLPAALAAEIGLKPSPADPTIRCQVADGSIVEAKQMKIPSMRVGKFTIKDVTCAVMPDSKEEVPPLLGGTFHKYFTYKFSADTGKLVLSKVETSEIPTDKARPLSKSAKGKRQPKPTNAPEPGAPN